MTCPRCGNLREECSDPDREWHPTKFTCWASASLTWGNRRFAEKHAKDKVGPHQLRETDGVELYVSPLPPGPDDDPGLG